jgi:methionyl-tRNA formyltransferase
MAWTTLNEESFRLLEARALGATDRLSFADNESAIGTVILEKELVLVACGEGTLLELKTVQPAGKKPMAARDWARGMSADKRVIYV